MEKRYETVSPVLNAFESLAFFIIKTTLEAAVLGRVSRSVSATLDTNQLAGHSSSLLVLRHNGEVVNRPLPVCRATVVSGLISPTAAGNGKHWVSLKLVSQRIMAPGEDSSTTATCLGEICTVGKMQQGDTAVHPSWGGAEITLQFPAEGISRIAADTVFDLIE
ncbi:hypothetical protein Bbelb_135210 [Branchiostoma belcheri]|nr:hypothetical protein Bbelb_135210 [Branchiostoma belcheri]